MADWQNKLDDFFIESDQVEKDTSQTPFEQFVHEIALPAFEALQPQFEKHGRKVTVRSSASSATITVFDGNTEEINFNLQERTLPDRKLPYARVRMRERAGLRLVTVEAMLRPGGSDYHIDDLTQEDVINCVLQHYMSRVKLTR